MKVTSRTPYSKIEYADDGAPFKFGLKLFFDAASDPYKTDFHIELDADLNFMMKTLLGGKLKEALDKVVDGLVAVSNERVCSTIPIQYYIRLGGKRCARIITCP